MHGDKRIVINGGWHDAGDLPQGLGSTDEIVYGLFSLAERLRAWEDSAGGPVLIRLTARGEGLSAAE